MKVDKDLINKIEEKMEEISNSLNEHINDERNQIRTLWIAIYGDKDTNTVGIKDKVDEIHDILTKLNGIGGLIKWVIAAGGAWAVIKAWFLK